MIFDKLQRSLCELCSLIFFYHIELREKEREGHKEHQSPKKGNDILIAWIAPAITFYKTSAIRCLNWSLPAKNKSLG